MTNTPSQHIGDGLKTSVWMGREASYILVRYITRKEIKHQKWKCDTLALGQSGGHRQAGGECFAPCIDHIITYIFQHCASARDFDENNCCLEERRRHLDAKLTDFRNLPGISQDDRMMFQKLVKACPLCPRMYLESHSIAVLTMRKSSFYHPRSPGANEIYARNHVPAAMRQSNTWKLTSLEFLVPVLALLKGNITEIMQDMGQKSQLLRYAVDSRMSSLRAAWKWMQEKSASHHVGIETCMFQRCV